MEIDTTKTKDKYSYYLLEIREMEEKIRTINSNLLYYKQEKEKYDYLYSELTSKKDKITEKLQKMNASLLKPLPFLNIKTLSDKLEDYTKKCKSVEANLNKIDTQISKIEKSKYNLKATIELYNEKINDIMLPKELDLDQISNSFVDEDLSK